MSDGPVARCWAVLPAAGVGSRMGAGLPKQYLELAGSTVIEHSLAALLAADTIEAVVVAVHPQDQRPHTLPALNHGRVILTEGGAQRCDSVLAGIQALAGRADDRDWVLVHDAARPCLGHSDLEKLIKAVMQRQIGGILAEPVLDTVKQSDGAGLVQATLDRSALWRAQTPQMFRVGELRDALISARARGVQVTDEASAMELAGLPVQLVAATGPNLKVTVPADLALAHWYLQQRSAE